MDLCRKKKIQVERSLLLKKKTFLVQFSLRWLFTQSRSSTESRLVQSSPRSFVFITSRLSRLRSIVWALLVFQYQTARLLLRFYRSTFTWTSSGGSHRQHPLFLFFMYVPFSCRTSFRGSLLFFYFEVEFLHLCLEKEKRNRQWAKPRFILAMKGKGNRLSTCVCL